MTSPCLPHRCKCGRSYDAPAWWALPAPPKSDTWTDETEDGQLVLKMRNCPGCGSTMAQPTVESAAGIVVALVERRQRPALPVVEEADILREAGDAYGFDDDATRAALALAVILEDLLVYGSPRGDAPPGTRAYRVNRKKRPF